MGQPPPPPLAPTQSPLFLEHKGPTQPTAIHSRAQGIHGEVCARGAHPPLWASLGVGPLTQLPPQRGQGVWLDFTTANTRSDPGTLCELLK